MKNPLKNLFKRKKAQQEILEELLEENVEGASSDLPSENISGEESSSDESPPKTKKELKAEKEQAKKEKAAEKKKAAGEKKAEKKKAAGEKKKQKADTPKPPKEEKPKKPKLTKEEKKQLQENKQQLQKDKEAAKAKHKIDSAREKSARKADKIRARVTKRADKIRARAAVKTEQIRLKKEQRAEKKHAEKEQKSEKKQFKKELRDEIKAAKKDMPKNKLLMVMTPIVIILLLAGSMLFLGNRGIGPLASVNVPNPVTFVKSVMPEELPEFIKSIKPPSLGILPTGEDKAEAAVEDLFAYFIALDFEGAEDYIDMSAIVIPDGYLEFIDTNTLMIATFESLECGNFETTKVENSEYEEYDVIADITAVNVKPLMASFVREALQLTYRNATLPTPLSQAELNRRIQEIFFDKVENPNLATVTNETIIKVRNADGSWKIIPDDDFINAIFGGVIRAAGDYYSPDPPAPPSNRRADSKEESEEDSEKSSHH